MSEHEIINQKNITLSNAMIEARYSLGLVEQKLYLYAVSQLNFSDTDFHIFDISLVDFIKTCKVNRTYVYENIDNICSHLLERDFKIDVNKNGDWVRFALFDKCHYEKGSGIITMCFHPQMKPFLLALRGDFTKFGLIYPVKFKSAYAIRIYQLIKKTWFISKTFRIDYTELRKTLGIEDTKYKDVTNFKKIVLERAKKEINEKSDIHIEFDTVRKNRRVDAIVFTSRPNYKKDNPESMQNIEIKVLQNNEVFKQKSERGYEQYKKTVCDNLNFIEEDLSELKLMVLHHLANIKNTERPFEIIKEYYEKAKEKNVENIYAYLKKCLANAKYDNHMEDSFGDKKEMVE